MSVKLLFFDGTGPFAVEVAPVAMACRRYDTPAGLEGAPTVEQLRAALS